jgi:small subunit ribosomal protein S3
MGQKVNPISMRIGINRSWDSKWYAGKKKYHKTLHEDFHIENMIREKLKDASVSKVEILRTANAVSINVHTAKPGLIIGRGGETIEALREQLEKKFGNKFGVNILEIKKPMLDAHLVAEQVARQVERRISYRRAAKMAIDKAIEAGAKGIKIRLGGRLNGVEIARNEFFSKGKIPLHTFRADIDYALVPSNTTYGAIGVKVWIYKGDIFNTISGGTDPAGLKESSKSESRDERNEQGAAKTKPSEENNVNEASKKKSAPKKKTTPKATTTKSKK